MARQCSRYRPPLAIVFVGTSVALLLAVTLPVWRLPYVAGLESTNDLSASFRIQLLAATTAQVANELTPVETALTTLANSLVWRPELDFANQSFGMDFVSELSRTVLRPILTVLPRVFSTLIIRADFANGTLNERQTFGMLRVGNIYLVLRDNGPNSTAVHLLPSQATAGLGPQVYLLEASMQGQLLVRDGQYRKFDAVDAPITNRSLVTDLYPTVWWHTYVLLSYFSPMVICEQHFATRDAAGLYAVRFVIETRALSTVLAASVTGRQRMFLSLQSADGKLVATSHGKYWEHSDVVPDLSGIAAGFNQPSSYYTPEQATDPIIRAVTRALAPRLGATGWAIAGVLDWSVKVPTGSGGKQEEWLCLSSTIDSVHHRNLRLWLLQDSESLFGRVRRALRRTVVVFAVLLSASAVAGALTAVAVAWPLARLSRLLVNIADMDFAQIERVLGRRERTHRRPSSSTTGAMGLSALHEVAQLEQAFGRVLVSVSAFAKYVPLGVVRSILRAGISPELVVEPVHIAVLFADIKGFTTLADTMQASAIATLLSRVLGHLARCIESNEGTIDKFIGDAVMALWGAPTPFPAGEADAARLSCLGAAAMLHVIDTDLRTELEDEGLPAVGIRIGINLGAALVGNVGSQERYNYTAIGAVVNAASRLEALNKQFGSRCLVAAAVAEAAVFLAPTEPPGTADFVGKELPPLLRLRAPGPEAPRLRSLGLIQLIGCTEPLPVHELQLPSSENPGFPNEEAVWLQAMTAMQEQQFVRAVALFERFANCPTAQYFRGRALLYRQNPSLWRGYEIQDSK